MSGGVPRDTDVEAVFQPKNLTMDIAPGLWPTGAMEGSVLVSNNSELDQEIEDGQVLGVVMTAAVRTTRCRKCGFVDTSAWPASVKSETCNDCGSYVTPDSSLPCATCGAEESEQEPMEFSGCASCTKPFGGAGRPEKVG